jgi:hypothetical protein
MILIMGMVVIAVFACRCLYQKPSRTVSQKFLKAGDCRNKRAVGLLAALVLADSVPERALLHAKEVDVFALSAAVEGEIAGF